MMTQVFHSIFHNMSQHVIKENAEIHWHKYCDTLDNTTKLSSVWNMAKRMNGLSSNTTSRYLITDDGQTVDNNIDKAELLVKKFSGISSSANYSEDFRKRKESVEAGTTQIKNDAITDHRNIHLNIPFSAFDLSQALRQVKNNSSPGEDGIPYEFIQHLPGAGKRILLKLYNTI